MFNENPPAFGSAEMRAEFLLDPDYVATNHGSYGSIPRYVAKDRLKHIEAIESNPDLFMKADYDSALDNALVPISKLVGLGGDVSEVVFTVNATTGVNAVLRSLKQILAATGRYPQPATIKAQKILFLSTVYGNVRNAINYTCDNDGFTPLQLDISYPISDALLLEKMNALISAERAQGSDIVLAIYDAISSVPGIVCPFVQLTALFRKNGILSCVDAAHAIGQIPVNLRELQADFLVTNLHKWLYVPRGASLFYCARRFHGVIRHPVISEVRPGDWRRGFHWVGTTDVSAYLTTRAALAFREWIGGEERIMAYCHDIAVRGGEIVAKRLGTRLMGDPAHDDLSAAMVNVLVPSSELVTDVFMAGLQVRLLKEFKCAAAPYKHDGKYWLRLSGQVYLNERDFEQLADALYSVFYGESSGL